MGLLGLLLKDPPFVAAAVVFLGGLSVLMWCSVVLLTLPKESKVSLRSRDFPAVPSVVTSPAKKLWEFPPPEEPPPLMPSSTLSPPGKAPAAFPAPSLASAPPGALSKNDPALLYSMMESKFNELSRRISSIESPKGQVPAYIEPLLKRVQEMESEVNKLKMAFTQMAQSHNNAPDVAALTSKVQGIQKILENLTGGTDVSRPS